MIATYVLEKEGRTAILCGVKHVDAPGFYEGLQKVIDQTIADGYLFFYEGVSRDPSVRLATRNARRLMTFWGVMIGIGYSYLGEMKNWQTQRESLRYSPKGVNADISLEELVSVIDRAGIKCSWPLLYVVTALLVKKPASISEYPFVLRAVMAVARRRFFAWFEKSFWSVLRGSFPFTVDYRNEVIFRIVGNQAGQKNILLLYGASHLPGLLKYFDSDGWKIRQAPEIPVD